MLELFVECLDWLGAVVHRNTYNLQPSLAEDLLQFHEMRSFFSAGIAPRRPEIQQHYLAAIGGKLERFSV